MRIAMLGHKRVPSREGGVEIVVEELGVRMAAMGHNITCYNRRGKHVGGKAYNTPAQKEYKGMRLKPVLTIDLKGIAAMSASFFAALCAAFGKYDVTHFHAEGPCAMLWLPKLFGKKTIATIHGLDHQRCKWGKLARTYIMLGEKCAARFADEIIVLNRSNQDYFKNTYGRDTRLIPNGVTCPEKCNPQEITEKFGLEEGDYLLYLGRIVPEKGVHYLINAFRQLHTDKKLVIAGCASDTGEYFEEVKTLAAGDERIIFTGFVQGRILEELYSNAYTYILPSDLEGMPLSLMEAMSYGNCCLVSDIPECADVVGDMGLLFKKGDVQDLKRVLEELLGNTALVQHYKNGSSSYICSKYDWDAVVKSTLELYQEK